MKFGPVKIEQTVGAILAHAVSVGSTILKKGRIISDHDVAVLRDAGIVEITVAQLESGDVPEDQAADRIARALKGEQTYVSAAFTGRANVYAESRGLVLIDAETIHRINAVDPSITVATLVPFDVVGPRTMLATVKIIPFAAPAWAVAQVEDICKQAIDVIAVAPLAAKRVALVSTRTPGMKPGMNEKNRSVTASRLAQIGAHLVDHRDCAHTVPDVTAAISASDGADIILVFGASANCDPRDVVPAAISAAGGVVHHVGMPVDPGNLLVLGSLTGTPIVGLPGCARSPKRNGFDWVLERLCADVPVTAHDVMRMGVGGLLKEIPSRPQPRDAPRQPNGPRAANIAALVLAAGSSSRMGANKLLLSVAGKPVLSHTLEQVSAAGVQSVIVVTGHRADDIGALIPKGVARVFNPSFASGMASSLKTGIAALPEDIDAVLVVLGDMPAVRSRDIATLIAAFSPEDGRSIIVPLHQGRRGHPIIFARAFWPTLMEIVGDQGGRQVLNDNPDAVCEFVIDHPGVLADADTPDALDRLEAIMTS